jgi:hypothetical protein
MRHHCFRLIQYACGAALLFMAATAAAAADTITVTINGNVATATLSIDDTLGRTHHAVVTITFEDAQNLTVTSLGLTAFAVNPADLGLALRLPLGTSVDADFPVMVRVEPPTHGTDWLYRSGFEGNEVWQADLSFRGSYVLEVHTTDLTFSAPTQYRLLKAPLSGAFADYSDYVCAGSVRARDRDGGFSEFLMVRDTRLDLTVALVKSLDLRTRILTSSLTVLLQNLLTGLLDQVDLDISLGQYGSAVTDTEALLTQIAASSASGDLPNSWRAARDLDNVAGNLTGRAASLRYSLRRLASAAPEACPSP